MEMLPCGRTDGRTNKQTSENRATQSLDSVRLSFAKKSKISVNPKVYHHIFTSLQLSRKSSSIQIGTTEKHMAYYDGSLLETAHKIEA